jgi:hypothetical protein
LSSDVALDFTAPGGSATIICLPQGAYELQEVSAASGYALEAGTTTAVVGSYNTYTSPATATVENKPLAVLLEKVDALDKSPLANVSFRIMDATGDYLHFTFQEDGTYYVTDTGDDCFQTDTDGKASILYILVGTYTLEEQQHSGFAPTGSQAFTVTSEILWIIRRESAWKTGHCTEGDEDGQTKRRGFGKRRVQAARQFRLRTPFHFAGGRAIQGHGHRKRYVPTG